MKDNIAIYGAGAYGEFIFLSLKNKGIEIVYFVDEYTTKTSIFDTPIYRIKDAPDKSNTILLMSVIDDIKDLLFSKGFKDVKSFDKVMLEHTDVLYKYKKLWGTEVNKTECEWLFNLFEDEPSKILLHKIIDYRTDKTGKIFLYPDGSNNYFPSDFDAYEGIKELRFADCGGFTGDTVADLIRNKPRKIDWIVSFEPDKNNLTTFFKQVFTPGLKLFIYPTGVSDKNGFIGFNSHGSSSKIINDNTSDLISTVTIDTVFAHNPPNFIKMDIEGAEKEAIIGAEKTIKDYHPNMSISLYHKPQDLWELPKLIHSIYPNYEFRIRLHGFGGTELILYCIPR